MSRITPEAVRRIAALARLSLGEEEAERARVELDSMLDYVEALKAVDTEGVEPTSHILPLQTPLREDVPEEALAAELAVANAPAKAGTSFVVPKVIDGEAG